jgi:hypothetical protein
MFEVIGSIDNRGKPSGAERCSETLCHLGTADPARQRDHRT